MSATPPLTVLMAVHNGLPYLFAAMQSVAVQSYPDFEWLIIDDASTDGSSEVLREWAALDPRIRLIHQSANQGLTATLNNGLAEARGDWIARQDSDDISHPHRFKKQMAALRRQPNLALLGTNGFLIDQRDAIQGLINAPSGGLGLRWSAIFFNPFIHSSVVFHREKIRALGGYDPSFPIAQDYDLWLRVMARWPVGNLPDRLLQYRVHSSSVTASTTGSDRDRLLQSLTGRALDLAALSRFATPDTLSAIAKLQGRLSSSECATFWSLHRQMLAAFTSTHPDNDSSLREAIALLHWKIAGASSGRSVFAEMLACLFLAPRVFLRLVRDRLLKTV